MHTTMQAIGKDETLLVDEIGNTVAIFGGGNHKENAEKEARRLNNEEDVLGDEPKDMPKQPTTKEEISNP